MVREMNHIGLRVCDVDAAIHLYADVLGGVVIRNSGSLDGKSRFVYVQLGGSVLEIITAQERASQGYAHVAFLTDHQGLDAAHASLVEKGYTFTVNPKVAGSGDGRLAFFRDDSGVIYELIEREENIRKPAFETKLVREFACATIRIKPEYLAKTAAFYTEELSFTPCGADLYRFGDDRLQVLPSGDGEGCIESISLKVFSLKDAQKALEEAGYSVSACGNGLCLHGAGDELICLSE